MLLPVEIQKAEVLDWWEDQQEFTSEALVDRVPALLFQIDQKIEEMPATALIRRGRFYREKILPLLDQWLQKTRGELTHELEEALNASLHTVEGPNNHDAWSYSDYAAAGSAIAVSAAPLAAIPLFIGATVGGIVGFGATPILVPAAVVLTGTSLLFGAQFGGTAVRSLKARYRLKMHEEICALVFGNPNEPSVGSLKHTLHSDLRNVTLQRLAALQ